MSIKFSDLPLNEKILKAIAAKGYTSPTPVQEKSIPEILAGKDVVACAPTGTGKTAAFVLPSLHYLCENKPNKKPQILILTPTRELASQITKAASVYGTFLKYHIVSLVGGMSYDNQIRELKRGADIIVATPGRLIDHIEQKLVDLAHVQMFVLDEADRMLDMGFIEDVEYIAKLIPQKRQTLLFSATLDNNLARIVKHLLKNPVRVELSTEISASPLIKQELYKTGTAQHKNQLLKKFLNEGNIFKAIVFSATKINADKLANFLRDQGFAAEALHGDLRQNVRNRTLDKLRSGRIQVLVATDVAARGIDISDITHVFNYDLPRFCEDYVHRIGRTGRAGKTGIAISFVSPADAKHVQRIERFIGQKLKFVHHAENPAYAANDTLTVKGERKSYDDEPAGKISMKKPKRQVDRREFASSEKRGSSDRRPAKRVDDREFARSPKRRDDRDEGFGEKRSSFRGNRRDDERSSDRDYVPSKRRGNDSEMRSESGADKNRDGYKSRTDDRSDSRRPAPRRRDSEDRYASSSDSPRGRRSEGSRDSSRSDSPRGRRSEGSRDGARSEGSRSPRRSEGSRDSSRSDSPRGRRSEGSRDGARSEGARSPRRSEGSRDGARSEGARGARRSEGGRSDSPRGGKRASSSSSRTSSRSSSDRAGSSSRRSIEKPAKRRSADR